MNAPAANDSPLTKQIASIFQRYERKAAKPSQSHMFIAHADWQAMKRALIKAARQNTAKGKSND